MPHLEWLLIGDKPKPRDIEAERRKVLEDLKLAQHRRQTQAEHRAWKKARELTNQALRVGQ
jgi:hypothetical protein